jgi:pimeloyl-ACP methyl ester carboxylesterase
VSGPGGGLPDPYDLHDPAHWGAGRTFEREHRRALARVGALELAYQDWGELGGRPIVLVHGFGVQSHTWDPVASVLARRGWRVVAPDLRGHGGSSWAPDGYRVEQLAGDVAGLLDQLGVAGAAVVGHSLGARVGLALAGLRPDLVGALVLSDVGPEVRRAGAQRATAVGKRRLDRQGYASREEAEAAYREADPGWAPVFYELHARHQLRENWAGKLVERADPDTFWITRSAGRADDARLWEHARRLSAPVLFVYGARSEYTDAALVARFAEAFPTFTAVELPTGHQVVRERPAEFLEHVLAFLG